MRHRSGFLADSLQMLLRKYLYLLLGLHLKLQCLFIYLSGQHARMLTVMTLWCVKQLMKLVATENW